MKIKTICGGIILALVSSFAVADGTCHGSQLHGKGCGEIGHSNKCNRHYIVIHGKYGRVTYKDCHWNHGCTEAQHRCTLPTKSSAQATANLLEDNADLNTPQGLDDLSTDSN